MYFKAYYVYFKAYYVYFKAYYEARAHLHMNKPVLTRVNPLNTPNHAPAPHISLIRVISRLSSPPRPPDYPAPDPRAPLLGFDFRTRLFSCTAFPIVGLACRAPSLSLDPLLSFPLISVSLRSS